MGSGRRIVWLTVCLGLWAAAAHGEERQRQLWITNAFGNDVHVYDVNSLSLVARFEVGANPHGISATADGRTVHIALENFQGQAGELVFIDAVTRKPTGKVQVGLRPNENECTPDGKWIYIPCADEHYWVVDGEKKEVVAKIHTGGRPHNTTISPDGKYMYLSPMGAPRKVTIVDIAAGHKVVGVIPFADAVRPPSISPDGKRFFQNIDNLIGFQVADIAERKVIFTAKHAVPAELANTQTRCHGIAVRPDGKEVWSCNVEHHLCHVHEATSGSYQEVAAIKMPHRIYWVCFSPDSKYGFVSVRSAKQVAVVDCRTHQIVKLLDAGNEPKRTQVIDVPGK